jgi:hypothetical protein
MSKEYASASISIYVPNPAVYSDLQDTIKKKWFDQYGQTLTKSEIIIKSMIFLNDYLAGSNTLPDKKLGKPLRISRILR